MIGFSVIDKPITLQEMTAENAQYRGFPGHHILYIWNTHKRLFEFSHIQSIYPAGIYLLKVKNVTPEQCVKFVRS